MSGAIFKQFRLITFDVTDTLLQFRSSPGKQYGEIGAMFGVLCDNNDLATNFKLNWSKLNDEHPNFGFKTKIGWENWWHKLIIGTFRDSNIIMSDDKLLKMSRHLMDTFKTSTCWQPCYGAIELLDYLKSKKDESVKAPDDVNPKRKFKMGVISNFDHRLTDLLLNMKLDNYFDFIINSYDAGYEKPQKEIFDKAMITSELENLKGHECLHIGDTPTIDYIGARAAGWQAVLINQKDPKLLAKKYRRQIIENHVFGSLFDFHKKITDNTIYW